MSAWNSVSGNWSWCVCFFFFSCWISVSASQIYIELNSLYIYLICFVYHFIIYFFTIFSLCSSFPGKKETFQILQWSMWRRLWRSKPSSRVQSMSPNAMARFVWKKREKICNLQTYFDDCNASGDAAVPPRQEESGLWIPGSYFQIQTYLTLLFFAFLKIIFISLVADPSFEGTCVCTADSALKDDWEACHSSYHFSFFF